MATIFTSSPWSLRVDRELIDVTTSSPSWRESWRATDGNGHEHRYDRTAGHPPFPTLNEVIDEWHWCNGDEGYTHHDPHKQVDESHFECKLCGETVKPETDPPYTTKYVPGRISATLSGPRSDGTTVRAWLTEDEARPLIDQWSDEAALALLDSLPFDRFTSITYSP